MHIEPLVTPSEAIQLFLKAPGTTICFGAEVANACVDYQQRRGLRPDVAFLIGCIWNAGRVQGIREERRHRKEKEIATALHQKPVDRMKMADGRTIPVFALDGYINTCEGWNRYCAYMRAKHEYEAGKQAYTEAKGGLQT